MIYKSVLIISDTHIPYHVNELLPYLKLLKKKYNPDKIIHIGDEVDKHAMSFHDSDPDLPSAGDELKMSLPIIKELEKLFPKMDLMDSNHGSLVYRRAFKHGIPKAYIKNYNDYLQVGNGWKWHEDITLDTPLGKVYFCHGKTADVFKLAQSLGMSAVQGHYHTKFVVSWWANPDNLFFGMNVGCLINQKSMAFSYAKNFRTRFILGCGIILNGYPRLLPMVLNDGGRWIRKIV